MKKVVIQNIFFIFYFLESLNISFLRIEKIIKMNTCSKMTNTKMKINLFFNINFDF